MQFIILVLCTLLTTQLAAFKYELAVLAIFQDEARFMKEWIEFNKLVGVEHFYLINDQSTDNYLEILQPYIDAGDVDLFQAPGKKGWDFYPYQVSQYNLYLPQLQEECHWVMIIDIDEYYFPVEMFSLKEYISQYGENVGSITALWQCYGTSHVPEIPASQTRIETLTWKQDRSFPYVRVKTIFKPLYALHLDTHKTTIMANKKMINARLDKLRVNHYWVGDEKYLNEIKIPRAKKGRYFKYYSKLFEASNAVHDPIMEKYVPALRAALYP